MDTIKNVTQLLIGKAIAESAATQVNAVTDLVDGEIVVTDLKNTVIDGTTVQPFKLIQRSGNVLIHSDVINPAYKQSLVHQDFAAETQQLDYVGYNGVSGALDEVASNIYTIRLYYQESLIAGFMQQKIKEGFYKSNLVASSYAQSAVAEGLVKSLAKNFSREAEKDIAFGMVTSELGTNTAGTIDVVQGSQFVTASADALTVGLALRLGTAVTDNVYIVESVEGGGVFKLSTPVVEATQQFLAAAADFNIAISGSWGVKLQGVDRLYKTGYFASRVARWKTTIDMGDSAVATVSSTSAYPGVGTGQQVATLEKELQADEHIYRGHVEGGVIDRTDADPAGDYDQTVVEYNEVTVSGGGTLDIKSPKTLQVAWADGSAQAIAIKGYLDLLLA